MSTKEEKTTKTGKQKRQGVRLVLTFTPEQMERIEQYSKALGLTRQQFVLFCTVQAMANTDNLSELAQIKLFS